MNWINVFWDEDVILLLDMEEEELWDAAAPFL